MLPNIWIFDTYSILMLLGIAACFTMLYQYFQKKGIKKRIAYSVLILACAAIVGGLVFAVLFQYLFSRLNENNTNGDFAMTFYGGLIGGAVIFILGYFLVLKKKEPESRFIDILKVAPLCITIAHCFGRIGCFCAGCCYGIETDSWVGVKFPGMVNKVYPTQLFEAIFLLLLSVVLFILLFKIDFDYTMPVYLMSYGVWRFLIEFIRGDDRGAFFLGLSPSQWISIIAVIGGIVLLILMMNRKKKCEVE